MKMMDMESLQHVLHGLCWAFAGPAAFRGNLINRTYRGQLFALDVLAVQSGGVACGRRVVIVGSNIGQSALAWFGQSGEYCHGYSPYAPLDGIKPRQLKSMKEHFGNDFACLGDVFETVRQEFAQREALATSAFEVRACFIGGLNQPVTLTLDGDHYYSSVTAVESARLHQAA